MEPEQWFTVWELIAKFGIETKTWTEKESLVLEKVVLAPKQELQNKKDLSVPKPNQTFTVAVSRPVIPPVFVCGRGVFPRILLYFSLLSCCPLV